MGSFSFKSVGKTVETLAQATSSSAPPIGIKTPLELGNNEGIFKMHFSTADQIHDNLRNLLLTNWGERPVHYDLGANLRELTSEFTNIENFDNAAIDRIKNAVSRWMPFVDLQDFTSKISHSENKHTAVLLITITYNVSALNVKNKQLQLVLYLV